MENNEVALMRFLLRFPPHVIGQLEIDPTPGTVYHISPSAGIEEFVPRQIKRIVKGEDELVPRICTATTLFDCFRGYAVSVADFLKKKANCAGDDSWLGGYIIYAIPHEGTLVPSSMMAPISKWCDERWLVDVTQDAQVYPAREIGKVFINALKVKLLEEEKVVETELLIKTIEPLPLYPGKTVPAGHYRLTLDAIQTYAKGAEFNPVLEEINVEDFLAAKERKAHLLSYDNGHSALKCW